MELPKSFRKHLSDIGKRGAKARWNGVSQSKRSAHARAMLVARWGKRKNGA